MKKLLILLAVCFAITYVNAQAPSAKKLIYQINAKFKSVQDYTSDVDVKFDIPSVKMTNIKAKVFYKRPNKFRMKAKGVLFLPKQNPMQQIQVLLNDTSSYTALISGQENIKGVNCYIVNVIPSKSGGDLVLGKFWIDASKNLISKSEITSKNGGTIITLSTYGLQIARGLPDNMEIIMDINKFKIPKIMAMDINKKKKKDAEKSEREVAKIFITFMNYKINSAFSDAVFSEEN
jgi:outer membrane lipoprotein-sorting protein